MSGFLLSPGITPELTDIFVVELPLAVGLGYLFGRRYGFELMFALNAVALGAVKGWTDYLDLPDVAVALAAIVGGTLWLASRVGGLPANRARRTAFSVLAPVFALVGAVKLLDFYDPFDILLADAVIVAAAALWIYRATDHPWGR